MIIVKLMGGLGNQMFQYAAARALALDKKTWVYLDQSFLLEDSKGRWTQREYELGVFDVQYRYERSGRINFLHSVHANRYIRNASRRKWWPFPFKNFYQPEHRYYPEIKNCPKNTYLHGYFQSEKYFVHHQEQIRKDFSFLEPAKDRNAEMLEKIRSTQSISVHVRRGDYVTLAAANQFHGLMGLDYYNAGVKEIINTTKTEHTFFVFSDEPAWAKENLKFPGATDYIDWNTGSSSFEDLRLMLNCQHHIIANSSFSWWGAWLNPSPSKIVVAPKLWFNDNSNQSDIVPHTWIRI